MMTDQEKIEQRKNELLPKLDSPGKVIMFIRGGARVESASNNLSIVKRG